MGFIAENILLLKYQGNINYTENRYSEAINCYNNYLKLLPNDSIILSNRGLCWMKQNELINAINDLTKSIKINPIYIKSILRRGICFQMLKQFENSLDDFISVLKLEPKNRYAHKHLKKLSIFLLNKRKKIRKVKVLTTKKNIEKSKLFMEKVKNQKIELNLHGQLIIGPPGSGKSTYCAGISKILKKLGRNITIVNLDPANEKLNYYPEIDITELVNLSDVMKHLKLGPNGGLMYCLKYLEENKDWLFMKLQTLSLDSYILFDLPGQIELFIHNSPVKQIIHSLTKTWGLKLTIVNLIDCRFCCQPTDFLSLLFYSLSTMIHLELPQVNLLSKIDMWKTHYAHIALLDLKYYTDLPNITRMLEKLPKDPFQKKYRSLNRKISSLISNHNLLEFYAFNFNDFQTIQIILTSIDQANGYFYSGRWEFYL